MKRRFARHPPSGAVGVFRRAVLSTVSRSTTPDDLVPRFSVVTPHFHPRHDTTPSRASDGPTTIFQRFSSRLSSPRPPAVNLVTAYDVGPKSPSSMLATLGDQWSRNRIAQYLFNRLFLSHYDSSFRLDFALRVMAAFPMMIVKVEAMPSPGTPPGLLGSIFSEWATRRGKGLKVVPPPTHRSTH